MACGMESFIRIAALENVTESQLIASILDERGIPHRIRSFHDTAYDGLFQAHMGWGEVHAPKAFKEEILEVIQAIRSET
jgi:hypothetical protein